MLTRTLFVAFYNNIPVFGYDGDGKPISCQILSGTLLVRKGPWVKEIPFDNRCADMLREAIDAITTRMAANNDFLCADNKWRKISGLDQFPTIGNWYLVGKFGQKHEGNWSKEFIASQQWLRLQEP